MLAEARGSVQAQQDKRVWRKWRGWVRERVQAEAGEQWPGRASTSLVDQQAKTGV